MPNFGDNITVDGSTGAKNFLALLLAKGFQGDARLIYGGSLQNNDAAIDLYVMPTDRNDVAPGVKQVESLAFAGTITVAGNAVVTVTAAGMTGSPISVNVPVTVGMSNVAKVQAAINALSSNPVLAAFFNFSITDPNILRAEAKNPAANDGTMNFAITDPNGTGITTVATSTHTTAGSLYTTKGEQIGPGSGVTSYIFPKGTDLSTIWFYTSGSNANIAVDLHG
jgi:hypothetical protein